MGAPKRTKETTDLASVLFTSYVICSQHLEVSKLFLEKGSPLFAGCLPSPNACSLSKIRCLQQDGFFYWLSSFGRLPKNTVSVLLCALICFVLTVCLKRTEVMHQAQEYRLSFLSEGLDFQLLISFIVLEVF